MSSWQPSSVVGINYGVTPNDGTGDPIYIAFQKVSDNFSNISSYLSSDSIDFVNANVELTLNAGALVANNITGTTATISTLTVDNLISAGGHSTGTTNTNDLNVSGNANIAGQTDLQGITVLHDNIVPSANLQYDLGSPTAFFRNIYSQGLVVNSVTASSDAGILSIHSNLTRVTSKIWASRPNTIRPVPITTHFLDSSTAPIILFTYKLPWTPLVVTA